MTIGFEIVESPHASVLTIGRFCAYSYVDIVCCWLYYLGTLWTVVCIDSTYIPSPTGLSFFEC